MKKHDNGGPAFPVFGVNCVRVDMDGSREYEPQQINDGMTLRDWFATHASEQEIGEIMVDHVCPEWRARQDAEPATWSRRVFTITRQQARYIHADRMLEARKS